MPAPTVYYYTLDSYFNHRIKCEWLSRGPPLFYIPQIHLTDSVFP